MAGKKYYILIVDDEDPILELLTHYFESLDYPVLMARNAEDAMKVLDEQEQIDLVISDVNLPGMSGLELLKFTRQMKPNIPVIMITGYKKLDFVISAIKYGAHDYIIKPFDLPSVRQVVEKVLRYQNKFQSKDLIFQYVTSMKIGFKIPTNQVDAGVLANYLAQFLLTSGFCDKNEFNQYYIAFMETIINAIEHGNLELSSSIKEGDFNRFVMFEQLREERLNDPEYGGRMIGIDFQFDPRHFMLTVTDEGPGFDWKSYTVNEHQLSEADTKPHGRGFVLIRHVVDNVFFSESGNSINLEKSKPEN